MVEFRKVDNVKKTTEGVKFTPRKRQTRTNLALIEQAINDRRKYNERLKDKERGYYLVTDTFRSLPKIHSFFPNDVALSTSENGQPSFLNSKDYSKNKGDEIYKLLCIEKKKKTKRYNNLLEIYNKIKNVRNAADIHDLFPNEAGNNKDLSILSRYLFEKEDNEKLLKEWSKYFTVELLESLKEDLLSLKNEIDNIQNKIEIYELMISYKMMIDTDSVTYSSFVFENNVESFSEVYSNKYVQELFNILGFDTSSSNIEETVIVAENIFNAVSRFYFSNDEKFANIFDIESLNKIFQNLNTILFGEREKNQYDAELILNNLKEIFALSLKAKMFKKEMVSGISAPTINLSDEFNIILTIFKNINTLKAIVKNLNVSTSTRKELLNLIELIKSEYNFKIPQENTIENPLNLKNITDILKHFNKSRDAVLKLFISYGNYINKNHDKVDRSFIRFIDLIKHNESSRSLKTFSEFLKLFKLNNIVSTAATVKPFYLGLKKDIDDELKDFVKNRKVSALKNIDHIEIPNFAIQSETSDPKIKIKKFLTEKEIKNIDKIKANFQRKFDAVNGNFGIGKIFFAGSYRTYDEIQKLFKFTGQAKRQFETIAKKIEGIKKTKEEEILNEINNLSEEAVSNDAFNLASLLVSLYESSLTNSQKATLSELLNLRQGQYFVQTQNHDFEKYYYSLLYILYYCNRLQFLCEPESLREVFGKIKDPKKKEDITHKLEFIKERLDSIFPPAPVESLEISSFFYVSKNEEIGEDGKKRPVAIKSRNLDFNRIIQNNYLSNEEELDYGIKDDVQKFEKSTHNRVLSILLKASDYSKNPNDLRAVISKSAKKIFSFFDTQNGKNEIENFEAEYRRINSRLSELTNLFKPFFQEINSIISEINSIRPNTRQEFLKLENLFINDSKNIEINEKPKLYYINGQPIGKFLTVDDLSRIMIKKYSSLTEDEKLQFSNDIKNAITNIIDENISIPGSSYGIKRFTLRKDKQNVDLISFNTTFTVIKNNESKQVIIEPLLQIKIDLADRNQKEYTFKNLVPYSLSDEIIDYWKNFSRSLIHKNEKDNPIFSGGKDIDDLIIKTINIIKLTHFAIYNPVFGFNSDSSKSKNEKYDGFELFKNWHEKLQELSDKTQETHKKNKIDKFLKSIKNIFQKNTFEFNIFLRGEIYEEVSRYFEEQNSKLTKFNDTIPETISNLEINQDIRKILEDNHRKITIFDIKRKDIISKIKKYNKLKIVDYSTLSDIHANSILSPDEIKRQRKIDKKVEELELKASLERDKNSIRKIRIEIENTLRKSPKNIKLGYIKQYQNYYSPLVEMEQLNYIEKYISVYEDSVSIYIETKPVLDNIIESAKTIMELIPDERPSPENSVVLFLDIKEESDKIDSYLEELKNVYGYRNLYEKLFDLQEGFKSWLEDEESIYNDRNNLLIYCENFISECDLDYDNYAKNLQILKERKTELLSKIELIKENASYKLKDELREAHNEILNLNSLGIRLQKFNNEQEIEPIFYSQNLRQFISNLFNNIFRKEDYNLDEIAQFLQKLFPDASGDSGIMTKELMNSIEFWKKDQKEKVPKYLKLAEGEEFTPRSIDDEFLGKLEDSINLSRTLSSFKVKRLSYIIKNSNMATFDHYIEFLDKLNEISREYISKFEKYVLNSDISFSSELKQEKSLKSTIDNKLIKFDSLEKPEHIDYEVKIEELLNDYREISEEEVQIFIDLFLKEGFGNVNQALSRDDKVARQAFLEDNKSIRDKGYINFNDIYSKVEEIVKLENDDKDFSEYIKDIISLGSKWHNEIVLNIQKKIDALKQGKVSIESSHEQYAREILEWNSFINEILNDIEQYQNILTIKKNYYSITLSDYNLSKMTETENELNFCEETKDELKDKLISEKEVIGNKINDELQYLNNMLDSIVKPKDEFVKRIIDNLTKEILMGKDFLSKERIEKISEIIRNDSDESYEQIMSYLDNRSKIGDNESRQRRYDAVTFINNYKKKLDPKMTQEISRIGRRPVSQKLSNLKKSKLLINDKLNSILYEVDNIISDIYGITFSDARERQEEIEKVYRSYDSVLSKFLAINGFYKVLKNLAKLNMTNLIDQMDNDGIEKLEKIKNDPNGIKLLQNVEMYFTFEKRTPEEIISKINTLNEFIESDETVVFTNEIDKSQFEVHLYFYIEYYNTITALFKEQLESFFNSENARRLYYILSSKKNSNIDYKIDKINELYIEPKRQFEIKEIESSELLDKIEKKKKLSEIEIIINSLKENLQYDSIADDDTINVKSKEYADNINLIKEYEIDLAQEFDQGVEQKIFEFVEKQTLLQHNKKDDERKALRDEYYYLVYDNSHLSEVDNSKYDVDFILTLQNDIKNFENNLNSQVEKRYLQLNYETLNDMKSVVDFIKVIYSSEIYTGEESDLFRRQFEYDYLGDEKSEEFIKEYDNILSYFNVTDQNDLSYNKFVDLYGKHRFELKKLFNEDKGLLSFRKNVDLEDYYSSISDVLRTVDVVSLFNNYDNDIRIIEESEVSGYIREFDTTATLQSVYMTYKVISTNENIREQVIENFKDIFNVKDVIEKLNKKKLNKSLSFDEDVGLKEVGYKKSKIEKTLREVHNMTKNIYNVQRAVENIDNALFDLLENGSYSSETRIDGLDKSLEQKTKEDFDQMCLDIEEIYKLVNKCIEILNTDFDELSHEQFIENSYNLLKYSESISVLKNQINLMKNTISNNLQIIFEPKNLTTTSKIDFKSMLDDVYKSILPLVRELPTAHTSALEHADQAATGGTQATPQVRTGIAEISEAKPLIVLKVYKETNLNDIRNMVFEKLKSYFESEQFNNLVAYHMMTINEYFYDNKIISKQELMNAQVNTKIIFSSLGIDVENDKEFMKLVGRLDKNLVSKDFQEFPLNVHPFEISKLNIRNFKISNKINKKGEKIAAPQNLLDSIKDASKFYQKYFIQNLIKIKLIKQDNKETDLQEQNMLTNLTEVSVLSEKNDMILNQLIKDRAKITTTNEVNKIKADIENQMTDNADNLSVKLKTFNIIERIINIDRDIEYYMSSRQFIENNIEILKEKKKNLNEQQVKIVDLKIEQETNKLFDNEQQINNKIIEKSELLQKLPNNIAISNYKAHYKYLKSDIDVILNNIKELLNDYYKYVSKKNAMKDLLKKTKENTSKEFIENYILFSGISGLEGDNDPFEYISGDEVVQKIIDNYQDYELLNKLDEKIGEVNDLFQEANKNNFSNIEETTECIGDIKEVLEFYKYNLASFKTQKTVKLIKNDKNIITVNSLDAISILKNLFENKIKILKDAESYIKQQTQKKQFNTAKMATSMVHKISDHLTEIIEEDAASETFNTNIDLQDIEKLPVSSNDVANIELTKSRIKNTLNICIPDVDYETLSSTFKGELQKVIDNIVENFNTYYNYSKEFIKLREEFKEVFEKALEGNSDILGNISSIIKTEEKSIFEKFKNMLKDSDSIQKEIIKLTNEKFKLEKNIELSQDAENTQKLQQDKLELENNLNSKKSEKEKIMNSLKNYDTLYGFTKRSYNANIDLLLKNVNSYHKESLDLRTKMNKFNFNFNFEELFTSSLMSIVSDTQDANKKQILKDLFLNPRKNSGNNKSIFGEFFQKVNEFIIHKDKIKFDKNLFNLSEKMNIETKLNRAKILLLNNINKNSFGEEIIKILDNYLNFDKVLQFAKVDNQSNNLDDLIEYIVQKKLDFSKLYVKKSSILESKLIFDDVIKAIRNHIESIENERSKFDKIIKEFLIDNFESEQIEKKLKSINKGYTPPFELEFLREFILQLFFDVFQNMTNIINEQKNNVTIEEINKFIKYLNKVKTKLQDKKKQDNFEKFNISESRLSITTDDRDLALLQNEYDKINNLITKKRNQIIDYTSKLQELEKNNSNDQTARRTCKAQITKLTKELEIHEYVLSDLETDIQRKKDSNISLTRGTTIQINLERTKEAKKKLSDYIDSTYSIFNQYHGGSSINLFSMISYIDNHQQIINRLEIFTYDDDKYIIPEETRKLFTLLNDGFIENVDFNEDEKEKLLNLIFKISEIIVEGLRSLFDLKQGLSSEECINIIQDKKLLETLNCVRVINGKINPKYSTLEKNREYLSLKITDDLLEVYKEYFKHNDFLEEVRDYSKEQFDKYEKDISKAEKTLKVFKISRTTTKINEIQEKQIRLNNVKNTIEVMKNANKDFGNDLDKINEFLKQQKINLKFSSISDFNSKYKDLQIQKMDIETEIEILNIIRNIKEDFEKYEYEYTNDSLIDLAEIADLTALVDSRINNYNEKLIDLDILMKKQEKIKEKLLKLLENENSLKEKNINNINFFQTSVYGIEKQIESILINIKNIEDIIDILKTKKNKLQSQHDEIMSIDDSLSDKKIQNIVNLFAEFNQNIRDIETLKNELNAKHEQKQKIILKIKMKVIKSYFEEEQKDFISFLNIQEDRELFYERILAFFRTDELLVNAKRVLNYIRQTEMMYGIKTSKTDPRNENSTSYGIYKDLKERLHKDKIDFLISKNPVSTKPLSELSAVIEAIQTEINTKIKKLGIEVKVDDISDFSMVKTLKNINDTSRFNPKSLIYRIMTEIPQQNITLNVQKQFESLMSDELDELTVLPDNPDNFVDIEEEKRKLKSFYEEFLVNKVFEVIENHFKFVSTAMNYSAKINKLKEIAEERNVGIILNFENLIKFASADSVSDVSIDDIDSIFISFNKEFNNNERYKTIPNVFKFSNNDFSIIKLASVVRIFEDNISETNTVMDLMKRNNIQTLDMIIKSSNSLGLTKEIAAKYKFFKNKLEIVLKKESGISNQEKIDTLKLFAKEHFSDINNFEKMRKQLLDKISKEIKKLDDIISKNHKELEVLKPELLKNNARYLNTSLEKKADMYHAHYSKYEWLELKKKIESMSHDEFLASFEMTPLEVETHAEMEQINSNEKIETEEQRTNYLLNKIYNLENEYYSLEEEEISVSDKIEELQKHIQTLNYYGNEVDDQTTKNLDNLTKYLDSILQKKKIIEQEIERSKNSLEVHEIKDKALSKSEKIQKINSLENTIKQLTDQLAKNKTQLTRTKDNSKKEKIQLQIAKIESQITSTNKQLMQLRFGK